MSAIMLYNTRTRKKEPLEPTVVPGKVSMYVCGPTVYDRAHIGNARAVVVFDTLFRLLRHQYGADNVTYVRNFTDVDDKINKRAAETRRAIREITDETIGWYHDDMDALGALRPSAEPRATEFIGPMVAMIATLIARGHAYEAEGHVLFSVASYPEYGALSRRSVDDMRAGARVEVAPYKRDAMDFVLWKPSDDATPGWDSPWGRGRPGWHIECSAMARELLGEAFDIHGGGNDLTFPHHENEIAQSRCAHPEGGFARIWMHNEMLNVEGEKMSKSLGNFFTVRDLLDGAIPLVGRQSGSEIRMALLLSHYRDPSNYGTARLHEARAVVSELARFLGVFGSPLSKLEVGIPLPEVVEALTNDLDTVSAVRLLRRRALLDRYSVEQLRGMAPDIYASQIFLGFDLKNNPIALDSERNSGEVHDTLVKALGTVDAAVAIIDRKVKEIHEARQRGDYSTADRIRNGLELLGVAVKSSKTETVWSRTASFDARGIEALE